jgi:hypothetical protein
LHYLKKNYFKNAIRQKTKIAGHCAALGIPGAGGALVIEQTITT